MATPTSLTVENITAFASTLALPQDGLAQLKSSIKLGEPVHNASTLLRLLYPTLTHLPTSPAYTESQKSNWSQCTWLPAALIFMPASAKAVSAGIRVLSFFQVPFAVRSGGHTPFPGSSSISNGVLVSLEKLATLSLSDDEKVVSVGPGNRWGTVIRFLEPHGLAVVSGRVREVGVGGFLTGGGLSFWSTRYGLGCDRIAAAEVVLADGRIVTVSSSSSSEYADLLWALKGGSNNFGVVTRFDLYTHALPHADGVWGGNLTYMLTPETTPSICGAIAAYQNDGQIKDPASAITPTFINMGGQVEICHTTLFHAEEEHPQSLKPFLDGAAVANSTKRRSMADMMFEGGGGDQHYAHSVPARQDFRTLSIGVSAELYNAIVTAWQRVYQPFSPTIPGFQVCLTFQPVGKSIITKSRESGGNALGLAEEAQTWLCFNSKWVNESDDEVVLRTTKDFVEEVRALAAERGLDRTFLFLNDAGDGQKVIEEGYGGESLEKLRTAARKYDPEGVFQKLCAGGFKLGL